MPFSHHSHSGEFCGHATDSLEEVVKSAIDKRMTTFCMTEHMPRKRIDFYPEEEKQHTAESLEILFDKFYHEARRLQKAYADQIQLFVGFEAEWIRDSSLEDIEKILKKYELNLLVGSVHHVHKTPIDYDTTEYHKARSIAGGTDEAIFEQYFDDQLAMLQALKPPVVGHFDLIRLKSDDSNGSFQRWPNVWSKILRNLRFIAEYDGVVEFNSSSLRKGMNEAYPKVEICKEFLALGGRFTISDDSHGIAHIALNYDKVVDCIKRAGIPQMCFLAPVSDTVLPHDTRFPSAGWKSIDVAELEQLEFWKR